VFFSKFGHFWTKFGTFRGLGRGLEGVLEGGPEGGPEGVSEGFGGVFFASEGHYVVTFYFCMV